MSNGYYNELYDGRIRIGMKGRAERAGKIRRRLERMVGFLQSDSMGIWLCVEALLSRSFKCILLEES